MSSVGKWLNDLLQKEPAVVISTVVAALTQLFLVMDVFGWELTPGLREDVIGGVQPIVMIVFLLGPVIRQFVFAPATVRKEVEQAAVTGEVPPNIEPPQGTVG